MAGSAKRLMVPAMFDSPVSYSAEHVKRLIARARSFPHDQQRTEVRIKSAIITGFFLYAWLLKPVAYMWTVKGSAIWKAATAASLPNWVIAAMFVGCAIATLPHLLTLCFKPDWLHCKLPRKMAGFAAGLAAVLWLYLAVNVLSTRSAGLVWMYLGNVGACLLVGYDYGFSVNSQQLRERVEDEKVTD
jgi:hypothetical protein